MNENEAGTVSPPSIPHETETVALNQYNRRTRFRVQALSTFAVKEHLHDADMFITSALHDLSHRLSRLTQGLVGLICVRTQQMRNLQH